MLEGCRSEGSVDVSVMTSLSKRTNGESIFTAVCAYAVLARARLALLFTGHVNIMPAVGGRCGLLQRNS